MTIASVNILYHKKILDMVQVFVSFKIKITAAYVSSLCIKFSIIHFDKGVLTNICVLIVLWKRKHINMLFAVLIRNCSEILFMR